MNWILWVIFDMVLFCAGYFLGFAKGYNQRERDLERD